MNIVTVTQFVLKVFFLAFFIYRRDGPLENLWGGGGVANYQKKNLRKGKLNEKKLKHAN